LPGSVCYHCLLPGFAKAFSGFRVQEGTQGKKTNYPEGRFHIIYFLLRLQVLEILITTTAQFRYFYSFGAKFESPLFFQTLQKLRGVFVR